MIVWMRRDHTEDQLAEVLRRIEEGGCRADVSKGTERTVVGLIGDTKRVDENRFLELPWVERAVRISRPYKLVSREYHPRTRRIEIGSCVLGDGSVTIMAGPCSVEGIEQLLPLAEATRAAGGQILRGGAYKPRTSPYSFQGLGREGLRCLAEARERTGMPIVTEATGAHHHLGPDGAREEETVLDQVIAQTDILQIGARNMKAYGFLEEVALRTRERELPILLKRGEAATLEEFLLAAEYLVHNGNPNVILCLRGHRGGESGRFLRYTPDLGAIPVLKTESNLPVVFDPSHATGDRRYVRSVALAAVAAGADGLLIETHLDPERAWTDGQECVTPDTLREIVEEARKIETIRSPELLGPTSG
ncbi:MAG: 3-deoxy-7-phosphoheptulonate synthase [Candidatus Eisenbacteria bacterium]|nr:3-deoxy-7-phosphoheptulonate synthase [Candidatus Latescibacterota bacterium]MBD3302505.1 3-deoxy-7-phosphoheptulonate synthase [Candidatus Eisenbacteria bacterium]